MGNNKAEEILLKSGHFKREEQLSTVQIIARLLPVPQTGKGYSVMIKGNAQTLCLFNYRKEKKKQKNQTFSVLFLIQHCARKFQFLTECGHLSC